MTPLRWRTSSACLTPFSQSLSKCAALQWLILLKTRYTNCSDVYNEMLVSCPDGEVLLTLFVLQVDSGAAPTPAPAPAAENAVVADAAPSIQ